MPNQLIDNLAHLRQMNAPFSLGRAGMRVYGALETRLPGDDYDWRGLNRGGDPARPFALFQCTLDGWGEYWEPGAAAQRVDDGKGFCVLIPSNHRYRLPESSPAWTFLWAIIAHPYIASRVASIRHDAPAVISTPADSALVGRLIRLLEAARGGARDAIALEATTFDFYFEYERHVSTLQHPAAERERLLSEVRREVLSSLNERCEVEALAATRGMSRSNFAHHFKAVTGMAPAHYMTILRLEEAASRLTDRELTLETIAAQTGFANANHFCKVFRRHFHMSPGEYRRQIR